MSQVTNLAFFRGSVVNMSSALGLVGGSGICAYVASKHAIIGLTKDVTFIDTSGEKVLAEFFKEGAEIIATAIYIRHVVDNIERNKSNLQM
jgi:NAD(P)-dependent dehydrogenase (short-subunit alcohol dehydrogenase family)